jgi:hypothetical protein
MQAVTGVDDRFLRRVRWISLGLALVLGGFLTVRVGVRWGGGFAASALWSTANLWALERLIRLAVRPAGRQLGAILVALLVKIPLLYAVGIFLALRGGFPARSLLAGFSLPLLVIVLKAAGRLVAPRAALPSRQIDGTSAGRGNIS